MKNAFLAQRFRNGTYWTGNRGIYKKEPCMLNEDKIKLMTELALFEKKHASQMKTVNQYLKATISAAICSGDL